MITQNDFNELMERLQHTNDLLKEGKTPDAEYIKETDWFLYRLNKDAMNGSFEWMDELNYLRGRHGY